MTILPSSGLDAALHASWEATAGLSLAAGVAAHHLVFRPFEVDGYAWQLLFAHVGAAAVLLVSLVQAGGHQLASALLRVLLVVSAYNAGAATSILVYRAFFHPLRRFPGPFSARLSRFYALGKLFESKKAYENVQRLHQEYGDIVRVGPRELSINRPSAITDIYGTHTQTTKSPWYMQTSKKAAKSSLFHTRAPEVHKLRKRVWERGLGFKALDGYEQRVQAKVELLLSRIAAANGNPMNIAKYSAFFSFDVMADIGFSQDFAMLKSTSEHPALQGVRESMFFIGVIGTVPWLLYMVGKIPGMTSYNRFYIWCNQQLKAKRTALASEKQNLGDSEPRDVMSWLFKAIEEESKGAPLTESAVQEDARLLILAGSDTTGGVLSNALHLLANNPHSYRQLQEAIQEQIPGGIADWTYEKAKAIRYLDYVIQETLRLRPSVPAGLPREVPRQGLMIDGEFIPGGAIVAVPTYTLQRDARRWSEPLSFKPERWESLSTEKAPWIAFSRGQYVCPGRHLAMMGLRMVLSRIALQYDIAFPLGHNGERFEKDTKDTFTLTLPELVLVFTPR